MADFSTQVTLPYSADQLFALAADIERYPEFVPGYDEARIVEHGEDRIRVEQRVGIGGHGFHFHSTGYLEPPDRLLVRSHDEPFADLEIEWRFREVEHGCRVEFRARYEPANALLRVVLNGPWVLMNQRVMGAFMAEAHRRYGGGSGGE